VAALTIDRLRREGEAMSEAVAREQYLAHAGLKSSAELEAVFARHAAVVGPAARELALAAFEEAAPDTDDARSARMLAEWQAEAGAARALAPLDERESEWEHRAVVRLADGRQMEYARVAIEIANATDRRERLLLDEGRAALVQRELAPLRRERLQRERDFTDSLGVADGYDATFSRLSGIDLDALAGECEAFLRDTEAMWEDVLPTFARRRVGVPVEELTRADSLSMFRAREFDAYFPARELDAAVRRQVTEMGVDPTAGGRVTYDVGDREGKHARAFCAPVRVPEEVYLVLRPHGGASDWRTMLHELGHALHFGHTRADLPFEYRLVGDNSVTETYAMLFDHLLQDAGWLLRYSELGRVHVTDFRRSAGFEELHFLRRYAAKLLYERQVYRGGVPWDALPDLYVETLTAATRFRYRTSDAFVDLDPRFYSARYLRAWQLQAVLADALRERFDEDWFRNPSAGPWIVGELLGEGQRELATEIAQRVAGRTLSFGPLVASIERMLA
jgi:hypothetical protein